MRFCSPFFFAVAVCALAVPLGWGAEAVADWQVIVALDAGPQARPATQQEAKAVALRHLAAQEKALRSFLKSYPADGHAFEAGLRLARLLQIRAGMESAEPLRQEARRLLDDLDKTATAEQRVEIDFARITYQMRTLHRESRAEREQLLTATNRFKADHPADRRLPRLLVEVAHLYDAEPETQRSLLASAAALTPDEELKRHVADDLKRLDLLGQLVALRLATVSGKAVDLAESRGKVVLLLFFADWSPPSMEAVAKVQRILKELPVERVQVLGLSLGNNAKELVADISKYSITWPVGFDGKGWGSPTVRALGINTLPTVWLIDQTGRLRSLNALENTADQVLQLLRHPPEL